MTRTLGLAATLAAFLTLSACSSPPAFTGNGTNVHMQGGTRTQSWYVRGWVTPYYPLGVCDQNVWNEHGRWLGWYVDDSVPNEQRCVTADRAANPHALIVAATDQWHPDRAFPGATFTAVEWYPYCGNRATRQTPTPPRRDAYVLQWNFVWPGCPRSPKTAIARLWARALGRGWQAVLAY